jgi:hypothetical protein
MAAKSETKTTKAPTIRKPAVRRSRKTAISTEDIATRAYFLHLEGGGDATANWLQAERELVAV